MRRHWLAAIGALAALVIVLSPGEPVWAAFVKTYKVIVISVVVTPSPVALFDLRDPARSSLQVAGTSLQGIGAPTPAPAVVAQAQTNVPVKLTTIPDPTATYLHFVPHTSTLNAGYGSTTFPCAFEVYTWYDKSSYKLVDWGAGTVSTVTAGTFPIFNYNTTSDLSWLAQGVTTAPKAYANNGSPGETTWIGSMNVSQQHCIDLTLNVTPDIAAGTYSAAVQYGLYVLM